MVKKYEEQCHAAFEKREEFIQEFRGELDYHWKGFKRFYRLEGAHKVMVTGVHNDLLRDFSSSLLTVEMMSSPV
jgi:hypothetical protein